MKNFYYLSIILLLCVTGKVFAESECDIEYSGVVWNFNNKTISVCEKNKISQQYHVTLKPRESDRSLREIEGFIYLDSIKLMSNLYRMGAPEYTKNGIRIPLLYPVDKHSYSLIVQGTMTWSNWPHGCIGTDTNFNSPTSCIFVLSPKEIESFAPLVAQKFQGSSITTFFPPAIETTNEFSRAPSSRYLMTLLSLIDMWTQKLI